MKKIFITLSLCLFTGSQIIAQSDELKGNYLVLYSGKLIKSSYVKFTPPFFNTDSGEFYQDDVCSYHDSNGTFANVRHLRPDKITIFMQAVKTGKINMYSNTITVVNNGGWVKNDDNVGYKNTPARAQSKEFLYYNKGTGILKKAKYKNLKHDMADNKKCKRIVTRLAVIKSTEYTFYAMSLVLVIKSFAFLKDENMDNDEYPIVTAPAAALLFIVANRNNLKQKNIKKAIDKYNN
jgi:hypothetical protein